MKPNDRLLNVGVGPYYGNDIWGYYPASLVMGYRWSVYSYVTLENGGFKVHDNFIYPHVIATCQTICVSCKTTPSKEERLQDDKIPQARDVNGRLFVPNKPTDTARRRFAWDPPFEGNTPGTTNPGRDVKSVLNTAAQSVTRFIDHRCDFGIVSNTIFGVSLTSIEELSKSMRISNVNISGLAKNFNVRVEEANSELVSAADATAADLIAETLITAIKEELEK